MFEVLSIKFFLLLNENYSWSFTADGTALPLPVSLPSLPDLGSCRTLMQSLAGCFLQTLCLSDVDLVPADTVCLGSSIRGNKTLKTLDIQGLSNVRTNGKTKNLENSKLPDFVSL